MAARRVCMVGGGSFGTAMARVMASRCGADPTFCSEVAMWVRREEQASEINTHHTNSQYVGDAVLPPNLVASTALADVVAGADVVVLAVPHQFLPAVSGEIRSAIATTHHDAGRRQRVQVCSLLKSFAFDQATKEISPLSASIAGQLGGVDVSVLMGPNIYREMAADQFAEATLGYSPGNEAGGELLRQLFTTGLFSVTKCDDLVGVEMAGALKNCITLGCGFSTGLGMGMNTKTAIMRVGHAEISRFAREYFGAQTSTADEACGMGDLVLSCVVGRGQQLAAAFVVAKGAGQSDVTWEALEGDLFQGMKLPDHGNIREVGEFLAARGEADRFPLLQGIYAIAWEGAEPASILGALRAATAVSAQHRRT